MMRLALAKLLLGRPTLNKDLLLGLGLLFLILAGWLGARIYFLELPEGVVVTPVAEVRSGPNLTYPANFTIPEKDSGQLKVGQIVRIKVDAYPGQTFEGKITTIEPQISTDTRNIRVQATIANPERILKPGMFVTTTVVLPDKPPVITIPETAVDYTLYGDSIFLITEKKEDDGKTSLSATRSFVQTGNRIEGRAEILKGLKPGDRVVAVGQLKLQSGSAVTISTDPAPPIPAEPPRY